jgi:hypothetical protein
MPSSKVPLLSCQNPFYLNFNKKPFVSQAAYTQHIDRNIGCYNFIVKKSHIAAPHGASVSRCHQLYENEDVTWTSNKRSSLLQSQMVNDVVATGESPHPGLAQYSNVHFVGSVDSDRLLLPSANDAEEGMIFQWMARTTQMVRTTLIVTTPTLLLVPILLQWMKMLEPLPFDPILCIRLIRSGLFLSSRSWTMQMHQIIPLVKVWNGHALHLQTAILITQ